ncbi:MAG: helix-turn-helix domain-containing protein [Pseudomonadota bacterium]|nr:helix-turn-helix domain-containing protein [Pseudomonadota bacterium]
MIKQSHTEIKEDNILDIRPVRRERPRRVKEIPQADMLPLTLGVVLQQARQAKHMKLPSISKKLRIKEVYLDALEKGKYHVFPALVYGVGFLRSYAIFLGLNPDDMIARFHKETSDIKEEPLDMPRTHDPKILPSKKVIVYSLIGLFFMYLGWNLYQVMTENPLIVLNKPVITTTVPVEVSNEPAPITVDEMPEIVVISEASKTSSEAPIISNASQKSVTTKHTPMIYGLKTPARVAFVATGKTTIEVRDTDANRVLLKKDLEIGDRYHPDLDVEGLVLKTTNAGGLDVYVDGRKVKTLGKKGQTKAGIHMDADTLLKE